MRYDLNFVFKRMERVKAHGYEGPALVCAMYFAPLAGHVPDRAAIKYLAEQRDMEVWLVPIAGTRVLVPFKVSIPTPLGRRRAAGDAVHGGATAFEGECANAMRARSPQLSTGRRFACAP